MIRRLLIRGSIALLAVALLLPASPAMACPFCSAVSQTFTEEMDASDVAVFAKMVEAPPQLGESQQPAQLDLNAAPPKAKFQITEVLKGDKALGATKQFEALYFGEAPVGTHFLVMGIEPPDVVWATPIEMTERSMKYVRQLKDLPKEGADRLAFFQDYLEDRDEMLARDAYDEFARSEYDAVQGLKDRMKHDQLVAWIWDSSIPSSRKRLYFTMLSVCGDDNDLLMLETILKADDRQVKLGLDAAIACYLMLKGPDGMPLVEDLFFKDKEAEYTDTHSAIMALRFHAQQANVIPKDRIKVAFRHMLEQPKLADLIIPDLARMEDWEVMDRLVQLFKDADAESSWVRVPVINYLRACPLPEAKARIEELAKIDPESVKHAQTFFPVGSGPTEAAASRAGAEAAAQETEQKAEAAKADDDDLSLNPPVPTQGTLPEEPMAAPAIAAPAESTAEQEKNLAVPPASAKPTKASSVESTRVALPASADLSDAGADRSRNVAQFAVPAAMAVLGLLVWRVLRGGAA